MEAELSKKITEVKENHEGTIGVLLVDNLGLPIEGQGNFDKNQSGLISSIMKNAAKLNKILNTTTATQQEEANQTNSTSQQPDITAKIYFTQENLVMRHKNNLTLALRQKAH